MINARKFLFCSFVLFFSAGISARSMPILNEVDYDQPGADTAEFIEIYNAGIETINLSLFHINLINGGTGSSYGVVLLPDVLLSPGAYFVICANPAMVLNCMFAGFSSLQNGAPDGFTLMLNDVIVDALSYEGTIPGLGEGLGDGLVDLGGGSIGGPNQYFGLARIPNGADSDQNNIDWSLRCITPGFENSMLNENCAPPQNPEPILPIPAPGSVALLGAGLIAIGWQLKDQGFLGRGLPLNHR